MKVQSGPTYSKTDQTTKRRMSETLTAAGANNSAPNQDSARLESLSAENINLSTLLTLSQEEHVMRDLTFRQLTPKFLKISLFTIVMFSSVRLLNQFLFNL